VKCKRHLAADKFDGGSLCKSCAREVQSVPNRTAFNGMIQERDLPVDEFYGDLDGFINTSSQRILDILQEAINTHM
jgi:hypothetical protein